MDLEISNQPENSNISDFLILHSISKNTKLVVDRFEDKFAVCENRDSGNFIDIPKKFLSKDVKEGNIIKLQNNLFIPDLEIYNKEVQEVQSLARSLFKRKNKSE